MPTQTQGIFRSEVGLANDRPIDMEPYLDQLEPTRNPNFEKIMRKIGKKVAKERMKFEWRRRDLAPNTCTVTVADAAGQNHIEVDRPERINGRVLLYNPRTHELLLHNSDDVGVAAATVAIRSYTHATPGTAELRFATEVGDVINILPETHLEGTDFLAAWRTTSVEDFDYIMEIARRSSDISNIANAESYWDPRGERNLNNQYAMIELMRDINLLFYLSQTTREVTGTGSARRHAMGGLRQKITTNRQALGPGVSITPQSIGEILRTTTYQGAASGRKIAMAGQNAITEVSSWPVGHVEVSPREKEWGYDIKTIITPHGNLDLAYDPALTDENGLADVMAIIDDKHVRQVYLQTQGLRVIKKISNLSTAFRIVDGVTGTFGFQLKFEELHAWIEGI